MSVNATELTTVDRALGVEASLPRDNGELVFEEPWQGRALGMGVVVLERTGASWAEFRGHLVAAIASRPHGDAESEATAYYAAWLDALEALLSANCSIEPITVRRRQGDGTPSVRRARARRSTSDGGSPDGS